MASATRDTVPLFVTALIGQLQRCAAEQVDGGLQVCLQGMLRMTRAQSLCWTLFDSTRPGPVLCLATVLMEAPLGRLDSARTAHAPSVVRHVVRPGRVMSFEFSWGMARPADLSLVTMTLAGVGRWLSWLDLSHGPCDEQGAMPASHRRVLLHLLTGQSEKQITNQLDLNPNTVHRHVTAIYRRYGVRNRASLLARWMDIMR